MGVWVTLLDRFFGSCYSEWQKIVDYIWRGPEVKVRVVDREGSSGEGGARARAADLTGWHRRRTHLHHAGNEGLRQATLIDVRCDEYYREPGIYWVHLTAASFTIITLALAMGRTLPC